jgi:signal transduction histidine kinase
MEAGVVPTKLVPVELGEVAQQAVARAQARAGLLHGKITYSAPERPAPVRADREQLGRILDNLINNALTYSREPPSVTVAVMDGDAPRIAVEDHGIGIHPEDHGRIFDRFVRIDHPDLGPQPGTGLGLYIARELALRHGGSLVLERSEVGNGSRFVLQLPSTAPSES